MQTPTEMTKVEVKDDLGQVIEQGQKESLVREIEQYKKAIEQKKLDKEDYQRQADVAKRIREIQTANMRKLPDQIVWQFETIQEYWELQDKLQADKNRQENHMDKTRLERYDFEIKELERRISETQDALDKINNQ